jgi:hypothetical protein
MRRFRARTLWTIAGAAAAAAVACAGMFVGWRASRVLRQSAQEVRSEREIRFEVRPFRPLVNANFEVVSSPDVFLQATVFQNRLHIAGPSGLSEYQPDGTLLREFVAGRELPSSPLVALAVGLVANSAEPELILATAGEGVLVFDGTSFRQIYPVNAEARTVTAILPVSAGHLLIGTKKRGVLLYDGKQIRELHSSLGTLYVQALAGSEGDLWIGTLNQGVLHWHAGTSESFGEKQGLPDRQVQTIVLAGDKTYVGTPLGVAEFDRGRFSRALAPGLMVTALGVSGEDLLVGTEDQGVIRVPLTARRMGGHREGLSESSSELTSGLEEVQQFLETDCCVFVLTRNALLQVPAHGFSWKEILKPRPAVQRPKYFGAGRG